VSAAAQGGRGVLERILASTRGALQERKRARPEPELAASVEGRRDPAARRLRDALAGPQMSLIAEFKRRSPSAGALREGAEVGELAGAYERGGASAISVLTEVAHFEGSLEDLRAARASCALPLLRKDFIVERYQLYEACAAGADAVLLITAALDDATLSSLHGAAHELGLDALVEVHSREELARASALGAELIGVNNRDLRDFTVDLGTTLTLMVQMPSGTTVVSESGIEDARQLELLEAAGVHAVLVGETLMRAADPEAATKALLERSQSLMQPDGGL
jgi:indole-3-glycerol phosphate synthase